MLVGVIPFDEVSEFSPDLRGTGISVKPENLEGVVEREPFSQFRSLLICGDLTGPRLVAETGVETVGIRCLGHAMIQLGVGRSVLRALREAKERGLPGKFPVAEVDALVGTAAERILGPFLHPEYDLLNEVLAVDFSRPADGNEDFFYLGHAVEVACGVGIICEALSRRLSRKNESRLDARRGRA